MATKKQMVELRRALRAHALTTAGLRIAYKPFEHTRMRLSAALLAVADDTSGSFGAALRGVANQIAEADLKAWQGWDTSRDEIRELAMVLSVSLPKKLEKGGA